MSYDDKALRQTYSWPATTISGSATTYSLKGPTGRRGRVVAVHASVTTTIVGASVAVQVGKAAELDRYMVLAVGAQTAPEALATETVERNATTQIVDTIESAEEVLVTVTAGTSGALVPSVTVDWF